VKIHVVVLWGLQPCSLLGGCEHFGGTFCVPFLAWRCGECVGTLKYTCLPGIGVSFNCQLRMLVVSKIMLRWWVGGWLDGWMNGWMNEWIWYIGGITVTETCPIVPPPPLQIPHELNFVQLRPTQRRPVTNRLSCGKAYEVS